MRRNTTKGGRLRNTTREVVNGRELFGGEHERLRLVIAIKPCAMLVCFKLFATFLGDTYFIVILPWIIKPERLLVYGERIEVLRRERAQEPAECLDMTRIELFILGKVECANTAVKTEFTHTAFYRRDCFLFAFGHEHHLKYRSSFFGLFVTLGKFVDDLLAFIFPVPFLSTFRPIPLGCRANYNL